jgi:hypothetical protein
MKAQRGSGGIAPRILDLGSGWRWVVSFTPQQLCSQGMSPRHPLDRLVGTESRSGRGGEEINFQPLPVPNILSSGWYLYFTTTLLFADRFIKYISEIVSASIFTIAVVTMCRSLQDTIYHDLDTVMQFPLFWAQKNWSVLFAVAL